MEKIIRNKTRNYTSDLLIGRKNNPLLMDIIRRPEKVKALCRSFREWNKKGKSVFSKEYIQQVASYEKISFQEAEILITFIIGMYCNDVR